MGHAGQSWVLLRTEVCQLRFRAVGPGAGSRAEE